MVLQAIFNPACPYVSRNASSTAQSAAAPGASVSVHVSEQEQMAIASADGGNVLAAIETLDAYIAAHPSNGSALNNRAQAYLLNSMHALALVDIEAVLALVDIPATLRASALVKKSMVLRVTHNEEAAASCMEEAAALGNAFARTEAVRLSYDVNHR